MDESEELKIPLTAKELQRIRQTAEHSGLGAEDWAKAALVRILRARETREANGER